MIGTSPLPLELGIVEGARMVLSLDDLGKRG